MPQALPDRYVFVAVEAPAAPQDCQNLGGNCLTRSVLRLQRPQGDQVELRTSLAPSDLATLPLATPLTLEAAPDVSVLRDASGRVLIALAHLISVSSAAGAAAPIAPWKVETVSPPVCRVSTSPCWLHDFLALRVVAPSGQTVVLSPGESQQVTEAGQSYRVRNAVSAVRSPLLSMQCADFGREAISFELVALQAALPPMPADCGPVCPAALQQCLLSPPPASCLGVCASGRCCAWTGQSWQRSFVDCSSPDGGIL